MVILVTFEGKKWTILDLLCCVLFVREEGTERFNHFT